MKARVPLLFAVWLVAGSAHAVVVANYNFDDATSETVAKVTSDDTDAGSTTSNFTTAGGNGNAAISASTDMPFFRSNSLTASAPTAVTGGDYFSFTVTPVSPNVYSFTTLDFLFGGSNATDATASFVASTFLRASTDGGTSFFDVGTAVDKTVLANGSAANQISAASINLSGAAGLQNVTSPVIFRMYLYSSGTASGEIVRMDNVVLNANIIPEPSSLLLCGLGGGLGLVRRKRA